MRHPNSARFHELKELIGDMHDRKQADYGRGDDPFANVRAADEWGVQPWVGACMRMSDKFRRLQSLIRNGRLENETVYDSFLDIAVYALIAYVLYEQGEEPASIVAAAQQCCGGGCGPSYCVHDSEDGGW